MGLVIRVFHYCLNFKDMLFLVALIRPRGVTLHSPGVGAQVDVMHRRMSLGGSMGGNGCGIWLRRGGYKAGRWPRGTDCLPSKG